VDRVDILFAALVIVIYLVSLWAQRGMWYDAEHDLWFWGNMEDDLRWLKSRRG
jgi:hypothetical protein